MKREWQFWVYIMSSKSRRIYTGMTNDVERRVHEHKCGLIEGFTQKYRIDRLVYLERFHYVDNAIHREKQIKGLDRARCVALIENVNPTWDDLSEEWGSPSSLCMRLAQRKSRSLAPLALTIQSKWTFPLKRFLTRRIW